MCNVINLTRAQKREYTIISVIDSVECSDNCSISYQYIIIIIYYGA